MRTIGFTGLSAAPIYLFEDDGPLKAHPSYRSAKAGDVEAALDLITDLVLPKQILATLDRAMAPFASRDIIVAAPHALEATGDNAIPQVFAALIRALLNGHLDEDIIQINQTFSRERTPWSGSLPGPSSPGKWPRDGNMSSWTT